jgi:major vault protein
MAMENRQKIPVPRRSFLWSLNETSGEILTHIGPTEFTPSANDRIVRANSRGGFEPAPMEARPFVIARDGEYVLLENPVQVEQVDGGANGGFIPGGNKEKELRLGTKKIIPGPCAFPLWPGQSAEVRTAHKLGANQYLLVEVVGAVDESAPYFKLVIDSAKLSSVFIDADDDDAPQGSSPASKPESAGKAVPLRVGQRIVIQGRHTQFFIPPSGIEVVPALEDDGRNREDDGVAALPPAAVEELARLLAQVGEGLSVRQFSVLKNELRHRHDLSTGERAVMLSALDEAWNDRATKKGGKSSDGSSRAASDPYARKAVVLGPKNFCFLFDADGKPRIVRGPARVFPGPHDTFMIRGSRRRVYDAYELGEHQALYLRIISPISRAQLLARLPAGTAVEAREHFEAGYEFLVRGLPSVFFPFIEAEVLNPLSREPHVGNDHDNVVLSAIGIDQKSGIYVRDFRSGMVKMVRGETSYLVDPRGEEHVHRSVPHDRWNLWIGHAEPHKVTTAAVTTPWALSVIVPNNEAALITSRHGRRVVLGPRTELLEFEEQLTPIKLSKGKSKDGHTTITTAYLRIQGGRVADNFEVESSDFVRFRVKLALAGNFEGEPERWFNVEDPVKLLADTVRARIREAARTQQATQILKDLPALVRQALFAEHSTLTFPDNGMVLTSVDVLAVQVADAALADLFGNVQREAVSLQLQDQQAKRRVESTRNRDQIDAEEHLLQRSASQRMAETSRAEAQDSHTTELHKLGLAADRDDLKQLRKQKLEQAVADFALASQAARSASAAALRVQTAEAEAKAADLANLATQAHSRVMAEIDQQTAAAYASADAIRLAAIQRELVGALHAASDSEVMKAAATNMNLVALLGGKSPAELLGQVLRGSPLERSSETMRERATTPTTTPTKK